MKAEEPREIVAEFWPLCWARLTIATIICPSAATAVAMLALAPALLGQCLVIALWSCDRVGTSEVGKSGIVDFDSFEGLPSKMLRVEAQSVI